MATQYGDRWEVIKSLGEGGQAHTFLVKDIKGDNETFYVLKRLKNNNKVERFKREIEAIRNLSHENIVNLIDFDLEAPKPYLVTEYCAGGSLAKSEPFWQESPVKALKIFQQICNGVVYAHNHSIIHRDLKPDNIFLRTKNGPGVVGDFGICYFDETDGTRITLTDEAVGPRNFIAPELEDGRLDKISPRSDTYSLGKILYWLLSGGKIFGREKHREPEWDLKGKNSDSLLGWNNIYLEHVNRLLDYMIVFDPEQRRGVHNISILLKQTIRLVEKEYAPVGQNIPQLCTYCGLGNYVIQAEKSNDVRNFGFTPVGSSDWRVLVCNECGHVQAFRVDIAHRKDWWDRS